MTVGSIVVGVIILFIFLALVGNAVGLFDFGFLTEGIKKTEAVTETDTEDADEGDEDTAEVTVPDLKGMTREAAQDALNKLGLGGTYGGERESTEYPEGQIIDQTPSAGKKVEKNTTVTYIVSKGSSQDMVTVPDVTGMTLTEALAGAERKGLHLYIRVCGELQRGIGPGYLFGTGCGSLRGGRIRRKAVHQ